MCYVFFNQSPKSNSITLHRNNAKYLTSLILLDWISRAMKFATIIVLLQDMAKLVVSVWSLVTTTEIVRTKRLNWPATVWRFPQSFHQPLLSSLVVPSWTRSIPRDLIVLSHQGPNYVVVAQYLIQQSHVLSVQQKK